jgi:hypothetical protein
MRCFRDSIAVSVYLLNTPFTLTKNIARMGGEFFSSGAKPLPDY